MAQRHSLAPEWRLLLVVLLTMVGGRGMGAVVRQLNEGWEFACADSLVWRPAVVPGTVHQDLLRHGLIPDPFAGTNEQRVQWVERQDWLYRTAFDLTAEDLAYGQIDLVTEGLDTYATLYLNGAKILSADNMFVGHAIPVRHLLREGTNRLAIDFRSPMRAAMGHHASEGFDYPADNDHHEQHLSVYTRKAPYSYGWDWGIRLATSGIWRPVSLRFANGPRVDDLYPRVTSLTDSVALIDNSLTLVNCSGEPLSAELAVEAWLDGARRARVSRKVTLPRGTDTLSLTLPLRIADPEIWMPNGLGRQPLYEIRAIVGADTLTRRIGLRTLQVVNEPDSAGEALYFVVNGHPLFAKGANYIPQDALLPRVDEARLRDILGAARDANMNMLRVWGGGVYPSDLFFDIADEYGLLIWQDFMFACTPYPADPAFLANVAEEADYNIRRLRHHPSLAMWCGNNEILEALKYYGWQRKFPAGHYAKMLSGYDPLFRELLPAKVAALDPDRFYLHTSPYCANWGRPDTWPVGDSHNWGVWYGRKPFESLDTEIPRFMSEFGFQSLPEMKTLRTFAADDDMSLGSEVMTAHQKSSIGNELILKYMERDYRVPEKFDDFVYVALVMQGDGISRGIRAHRRHRPYCMGSLFWQLDDSWPVVSWSAIDYFGNRKALYYASARAFAPLAVDILQQGDTLRISLLNDHLTPVHGATLRLTLVPFDGSEPSLFATMPAEAAAESATLLAQLPIALTEQQRTASLLRAELTGADGDLLAAANHYFAKPLNLSLPEPDIALRWCPGLGEGSITLSTDHLARDIFLETPLQGAVFSDNFFDLLPGQTRTILVTSPLITPEADIQFKIHHLQQTQKPAL